MYNNRKLATAHNPMEIFLKFIVVLIPGDTVRPRCTFRLTMVNNLKFKNINGGRNKAKKLKKIIKETELLIAAIPLLEILFMTVIRMSNIVRRVSSLLRVTDVR